MTRRVYGLLHAETIDSVTYQAILREGEAKGLAEGEAKGQAKEARKFLLLQGLSRFGEPTPEVVAAVNALADLEKLEQLGVKLLQVSSSQELLDWNG